MAERYDIVDLMDQPTGRLTTKALAHRHGHIHRIAAVHVFRPDGTLLVQVHKKHGRRYDHSVGGHVRTGEDYHAAARREMAEELGLAMEPEYITTVVPSQEYYEKVERRTYHTYGVFTAKVGKDWKFVPNQEVDRLVEMPLEDIVELMNTRPEKFVGGFFVSLTAYLKSVNSPLKITAYGIDWSKV